MGEAEGKMSDRPVEASNGQYEIVLACKKASVIDRYLIRYVLYTDKSKVFVVAVRSVRDEAGGTPVVWFRGSSKLRLWKR
jgi:hypothetical protein